MRAVDLNAMFVGYLSGTMVNSIFAYGLMAISVLVPSIFLVVGTMLPSHQTFCQS